jgi:hypothetical protein
MDMPWLSLDKTGGSITPAGTDSLGMTIDAAGLAVGQYSGYIVLRTDTPYPAKAVKVTLNVNPPNQAPSLDPVESLDIPEMAAYSFTGQAADADLPPQTLTFSLDDLDGAGAVVDPVSGVFTWTPSEAQGTPEGAAFDFILRVSDGSASAEQPFTLTVTEANLAPVLAAIADQDTAENAAFSFTPTFSDPDLPANTLTFRLGSGAPEGMLVDADTGTITWTPTETQGGADYPVTLFLSDGAVEVPQSFTLTVVEDNIAPIFDPLADQSITAPLTLTFTISATDGDLPAQTLTYGVTSASLPAGAAFDPATRTFTWKPTYLQAGDHLVTFFVYDGAATVEINITITVERGMVILLPIVSK